MTADGDNRSGRMRLGVVSFLNARPLIAGIEADPRVALLFDVPAALPGRLERGELDVALVPVIDVLRSAGRWRVVGDACIGCDGETMTVRVFARVPLERVRTLWVDSDSHTSVALARVLWRERYGCDVALRTLPAEQNDLTPCEAVLLIGDKVVGPRGRGFDHALDLGQAWREHTGLPFVFAVWAAPHDAVHLQDIRHWADLRMLLEAARDRGVARASQIADECGPRAGWQVEIARRYLTRCLRFRLDERMIAGVGRFARSCAAADLAPADGEIVWPADLEPKPSRYQQ